MKSLSDQRLRWVILGLLFGSTFLNYFDRQVFSVLKSTIKLEFGLTDSHYSALVGIFMAGYIVMYPIGGRLVDLYGPRRCMLVFVSVWSLATLVTGFANGFVYLMVCRVILGLAEPGNYPAALRTTTIWFPPEHRGFAASVFSGGSALGAILAPPIIAWIAHLHGWRDAFVIAGSLGFIWIVAWGLVYRDPSVAVSEAGAGRDAVPHAGWSGLLRSRTLWTLVLARLISDPVWYFLLFWFPGYIQEKMGLSLSQAGAVGWIPFLVADLGGIALAALSDRLVRGGRPPVRARLTILFVSALFAPLSLTLGFFNLPLAWALVVFSVLALVCTTWLFIMAALIADAAPRSSVATVHGISGAFGATGGLIFNSAVGPVVDAVGYTPVFVAAGALHLLAAALLWRGLAGAGSRSN